MNQVEAVRAEKLDNQLVYARAELGDGGDGSGGGVSHFEDAVVKTVF